ncbi:MAG TPA: hypothetical protein VF234_05410 [Limnochordia bacterium]
MRMDNETYRLKAENLLARLVTDEGEWDPDVRAELEELALAPRKTRYFLKALAGTPVPVQVHFYRHVLARADRDEMIADLERQIRHRFYEARDEAKQVLAELRSPAVLPALFKVIALTEEGWLAGELIRLVLTYPPEELAGPLREALHSGDYLLQCLAIYLVGKAQDDSLLELLADFYRRPFGEKLDRLEKKAHEALWEGGRHCSPELIIKWMKDKNARLRDLGVGLAGERRLPQAAADLVGLLLIDPKTRTKTAETLLAYESEGVLRFERGEPATEPIARLLQRAKQEPLIETFQGLLRHDAIGVRLMAVKLVPFLSDAAPLGSALRRLAVEDYSPPVQAAALRALSLVDREKLVPTLVDIFTDASGGGTAREVLDVAQTLVDEVLAPKEAEEVRTGVKAKQEKREAAYDRFAGSVEWWRHDI